MEKYIILNNGVKIPRLGFGTDYLTGEECKQSVISAIETGYRLIDTAYVYKNEKEINKAVHDCISGGIVKREDLFITTKTSFHLSGEKETRRCFEESLNNLGLDYIDLYLIHQPYWDRLDWREHTISTYRVLEDLYSEGKVKAIGVCNFYYVAFLNSIARIAPQINQIECHPQRQYKKFIEDAKKYNIQPMAWGTLNQGCLFESDIIKNIAKKYDKTEAQVAIRWNLQYGCGIALVRSAKKERIEENFNVWDFELSHGDKKEIDRLDGTGRGRWEDECGMSTLPIGNAPQGKFWKKMHSFVTVPEVKVLTCKLFGFVPFLKKVRINNRITKIYLFGILVLKIDKKL